MAYQSRGKRIPGIDLARAVAMVGMFMVHVGPVYLNDAAGRMYALPHGRASVLFVFLAGVGVSLMASAHSSPAGARLKLAWRAFLFLPLGLLLQELNHGVLVILQVYALLFALAAVVISLADRWLLALAAASHVFGPLVFWAGRLAEPLRFQRDGVAMSDSLRDIVHGLVLSGPYPLIVWAAPFLLGMWVGRRDLRARSTRVALVAGGIGLAWLSAGLSRALEAALDPQSFPFAWRQLADDGPHSQMPLWLAGSIGSAALTLGVCLVAADRFGALLRPLLAMGQTALSVYVAHLLALHWWHDVLQSPEVGKALLIVVGMAAVAAGGATWWLSRWPRGPLEALARMPIPEPRESPEPGKRHDTGIRDRAPGED